jgi:hypothetical protein
MAIFIFKFNLNESKKLKFLNTIRFLYEKNGMKMTQG